MPYFISQNRRWLYPLLLFGLLTPWLSELDIALERLFYTSGAIPDERFVDNFFVRFIFDYGPWPGLAISIGAVIFLVFSWYFDWQKKWRAACVAIALTMAVGSGLIVHLILKDNWGRPRPKQVTLFGGQQEFRPFYKPNFFHQPEPSKSFPCGHCTTGFFFFVLALVGEREKMGWLKYTGYSLAIILGVLLAIGRMIQGGHFLSDTLAGALIMWWIALAAIWVAYSVIPSSKGHF